MEGERLRTVTGPKVGKYTRWDPEGDDQAYIYKLLHKNKDLAFKPFIKKHQDWEKRYKVTTLRNNFSRSKKRIKDFLDGNCK